MKLPQPAHALLTLLCAVAASSPSWAQQIHRIVGPHGKVTFSDRAPSKEAATEASSQAGSRTDPGAANAALPIELRQISARFPVTLYTGNNCTPCVSARNLLMLRGVPFTERTVNSNEDIDALQRLSGSTSLPFGTIGGQQLLGFSDGDWTQYLDAAGYPKQSRLPKNYRQPAATPLVAPQPPAAKVQAPADDTPAAPTTERARRAPPPPPPPGTPTPSNPAGIRF